MVTTTLELHVLGAELFSPLLKSIDAETFDQAGTDIALHISVYDDHGVKAYFTGRVGHRLFGDLCGHVVELWGPTRRDHWLASVRRMETEGQFTASLAKNPGPQ
jgi:hypothetical protein